MCINFGNSSVKLQLLYFFFFICNIASSPPSSSLFVINHMAFNDRLQVIMNRVPLIMGYMLG